MTPHARYIVIAALAGFGAAAYLALMQPQDAPQPEVVAPMQPPRATAWGASPFGRGAAEAGGASRLWFAGAPSAAVYGRNGRTIDFGGKDAAAYIAQWSSLARTGNADAAYKVYQAAGVCANNDEAAPEFITAAENQRFLHERVGLEQLCAGVTPAQVQERMTFLRMAAQAGNADAQIDFYMEGPNGRPLSLAENADDPAVATWKEDSLVYLKAASAQGQPFALALLSLVYDVGEVAPQDLKMSLAYAAADAAARNAPLSPALVRNRFSGLSDAEFADALRLGAQIADSCCKH